MVAPSDEKPILIAQAGPLDGQQWAFINEFVLGRDTTCDIVIPSRQVSRHHARISPRPNGFFLEDLRSKNGTHLNGERVERGTYLNDGDHIHIALAQEFVFVSADSTVPLGEAFPALPRAGRRLLLEKHSRRVFIGKNELVPALSVAQYRLLELLFDENGRVVSRDRLTEEVWGIEEALEISAQALDALIRRLRTRLAQVDPGHEYIQTVRGHGLRLDNPER